MFSIIKEETPLLGIMELFCFIVSLFNIAHLKKNCIVILSLLDPFPSTFAIGSSFVMNFRKNIHL